MSNQTVFQTIVITTVFLSYEIIFHAPLVVLSRSASLGLYYSNAILLLFQTSMKLKTKQYLEIYLP